MLMRWCITAPLKHGGNAATNRGPERPDGPTAWLQGKTTLARKAANGWKLHFEELIPLPRGRRLVTLEDAGKYITKLPNAAPGEQRKTRQRTRHWRASRRTTCATAGGAHDVIRVRQKR